MVFLLQLHLKVLQSDWQLHLMTLQSFPGTGGNVVLTGTNPSPHLSQPQSIGQRSSVRKDPLYYSS